MQSDSEKLEEVTSQKNSMNEESFWTSYIMKKFYHKSTIKFLLFLWIVSSFAYILLFRSLLSDGDEKLEHDKTGQSKSDYPTFDGNDKSFSSSTNLSKSLVDVWSCEDLKKEISDVGGSYNFGREPKGKQTSYCLLMMESFQRCVGYPQNPDDAPHLLPNAYLASEDKKSFEKAALAYRFAHIYFVHVMKSSGTSIEGILRRKGTLSHGKLQPVLAYYCSHMLYFYKGAKTNPNMRYISLDKRSFGLHKMVPDPGYYVTILRNPVDRFVSMYYYIKQDRYPRLLEDQLFDDIFNSENLDDFLEKTKNKQLPFFDNHSIRMFHFDRFPEVFSTFSGGKDTYIPGSTEIVKINQSHYEEALRNLKNCAFVGITEHFDESQRMLEKLLGLGSTRTVAINVNKNYKKNSVTETQRKLIEPRVEYDLKLYEDALKIFKSQYNNFVKFYR